MVTAKRISVPEPPIAPPAEAFTSSAADVAVNKESAEALKISLPPVVPSLLTRISPVPASRFSRVISPEAPPVPIIMVISSLLVVVSMIVPSAIVKAAAPASRLAPSARASFAVAVNAPSIVTFALTRILLPACKVRFPVPAEESTAWVTVISVLACKIRLVPFRAASTFSSEKSAVAVGLSEKTSLAATASTPPSVIVIFFGSINNVPLSPFSANKSTDPWNIILSLPDTSTKPPSPLDKPPFASIFAPLQKFAVSGE